MLFNFFMMSGVLCIIFGISGTLLGFGAGERREKKRQKDEGNG